MQTLVDLEKSADGRVFNRENLTIYSFCTQPCDIKQSLLNLNLLLLTFHKRRRDLELVENLLNRSVTVIYRICLVLELFPFGCFALTYIMCLTNISILCEGLCENAETGQGKRSRERACH